MITVVNEGMWLFLIFN